MFVLFAATRPLPVRRKEFLVSRKTQREHDFRPGRLQIFPVAFRASVERLARGVLIAHGLVSKSDIEIHGRQRIEAFVFCEYDPRFFEVGDGLLISRIEAGRLVEESVFAIVPGPFPSTAADRKKNP